MKKAAALLIIISIIFCLSGCRQYQVQPADEGFIYQGKTYRLTSKHIFSHYSDLGFDDDEWKFSRCKLEYIGEGKITFIESRSKNNWYALDDHFLIRYDNSMFYMFSRIWLHTDTGLTQPDFTTENISEIQECIGVPKYYGYSEFDLPFEKSDNTLEKLDDHYLYTSKSINDKDFIERFVNELNENNNVDALIEEAKKVNADTIKEAQAKRDEQIGPNETVTVYYKASFKDTDFPFKLIFIKQSDK